MNWLYWLRFLFVVALVSTVILVFLMIRTGSQPGQRKSGRGESKDL